LFLSPFQDYFNEVGAQKVPSESTVDDFSPIIYFEILGKRMIFTGDAGQTVEEKVLSNYLTGIYNHYLDGGNKQINLEKIDLIKLAKGGANGASSIDFLRVLRPDYAVFSVAGANNQSAPSSAVIERLIEVNEKVKLYRTDEDGNITVKIDNNSEILILTEGDNYV
jgi:beta-lactamase superfamily II metal-dependent hydrolase